MKDFWKRKRNKRIAASALAVVMAGFLVWGLFPWQAAAAESDPVTAGELNSRTDTQDVGRVWTDKSVSSGDITLDAKATGKDAIKIEKGDDSDFLIGLSAMSSAAKITGQVSRPLDIVLVLDVSGSMDEILTGNAYIEVYSEDLDKSKTYYAYINRQYVEVSWSGEYNSWGYYSGLIYTRYNRIIPKMSASDSDENHVQLYTMKQSEKKITALKNSVNNFLDSTQKLNAGITDDTKKANISLVKFAGNENLNTGNEKDDNGYNYTQIVNDFSSDMDALKSKVNSLSPSGMTRADFAMSRASALLNGKSARKDAQKVVVFFTDGQPTSWDGFEDKIANAAIAKAYELETKSNTLIYTVGVFNGADPSDTKSDFNRYMNALSSNYPEATTYTNLGQRVSADKQYYKAATNPKELNTIFENIIQDVIHMTADHPTEVDMGAGPDSSGYVTFEDPLGQYMEVKSMDSIIFGGKRYTKHKSETTGDTTKVTFTETSGGNALYPKANLDDIQITITKSKDLKTGDVVKVEIPAAMIPVKMYQVTIDKDGKATTTLTDTAPIRLFYNVKLKADVKEALSHPDKALQDYIADNTQDGKVQFYANLWHTENNEKIADVTSSFVPAKTNDFYYFQRDTILYTDKECTQPVKGDINKDATYYYTRTYYAQGSTKAQTRIVEIPGSSNLLLQGYSKEDQNHAGRYIPAGTPRATSLNGYKEEKKPNTSETASYVIDPDWEAYMGDPKQQNSRTVSNRLGNNGRLTEDVPGALQVSKKVTAAEGHTAPSGDQADDFTFTVKLDAPAGKTLQDSYEAQIFDAEGNQDTDTLTKSDQDTLTFTLKGGQNIKIYGLDAGVDYRVTESEKIHYTEKQKTGYSGRIESGRTAEASFTNEYQATSVELADGAFKVKKNYNAWESVPDSFQFLLKGFNNAPMPEGSDESENTKVITVDKDVKDYTKGFGKITYDKPGTYYYELAEEQGSTAGISYSAAKYDVEVKVIDQNGTLQANVRLRQTTDDTGAVAENWLNTTTATFTNTFEAESQMAGPNVFKRYTDYTGSKQLADKMFQFTITKLDDNAPFPANITENSYIVNNTGIDVAFEKIPFTVKDIGKTYSYSVQENIPQDATEANHYTVNGMTYDPNVYIVKLAVTAQPKESGQGSIIVVTQTWCDSTGDPLSSDQIKDIVGADLYKEHGDRAIAFRNSYRAADVTLEGNTALGGTKRLTGRDMTGQESFTFTLTGEDKAIKDGDIEIAGYDKASGKATTTLSGAKNGDYKNFNFDNVTFKKAGTYTFTIEEQVPNQDSDGMTWDRHKATATVTVTDKNGQLEATVAYSGTTTSEGRPLFENTYHASMDYSTGGGLEVSKTLNGRQMEADEFHFTITAGGSTVAEKNAAEAKLQDIDKSFANDNQRASGEADVMKKLQKMTFTQDDAGKTYTYIVKEVLPQDEDAEKAGIQKDGVTYDQSQYQIEIRVVDHADGTMETVTTVKQLKNSDGETIADPQEQRFESAKKETPSVAFTNTYVTGDVEFDFAQIQLKKIFSGRTWKDSDTFQFRMENTKAPSGVTAPMPDPATITVGKPESGNSQTFDFGKLTFTQPGEYQYTVEEVIPKDSDKIPGVAYDYHKAEINILVTDNGKGQLVATARSVTGTEFNNTYTTKSLKLSDVCSIAVTKTLYGHDMTERQFEFTIKAANKASADKWPISSENGTTFKNPKAVADGTTETLINNLNMTLTQSDIGKTYSYTFAETKGDAAGYTYDENQYKLEITTIDNGNGTLKANVVLTNTTTDEKIFNETVSNENPAEVGITIGFENRYNGSTDVDGGTTADVKADKTLTGRSLKAEEFTFMLAPKLADGSEGKVLQTEKNKDDGTIPFEALSYRTSANAAGDGVILSEAVKAGYATKVTNDKGTVYTLYYRVYEDTTSLPKGVTLTPTNPFIDFTVTVTDNGDGTLTAVTNYPDDKSKFGFVNQYGTDNVDVNITGSKILKHVKGLTPNDITGKFTFTLEAVTKGAPMPKSTTATNDAAGNVDFGNITFDLDLLNGVTPAKDGSRSKTFEYKVTESGSAAGVTNDTKKTKTFKITLTDDGNGGLTAIKDSTQDPAFTFTNTYTVGELPSSITDQINIDKELTGRDLKKGEFSFELLENGKVVATGSNDASGNVTFDKITYTQPGDHTYTVREVNNGLGGVTYDDQAYTVRTTITDNRDGTMNAEHEAYALIDGKELAPVDEITFTNKYEAKGTTASIGAVKRLTGKDLKDGQFTFQLKDETGKVIDEAKNDKTGAISFKALEFDKAGTYKYTISEVNDKQKEIKYDTSEKAVTITVKDSGDGYLQAQVESEKQLIFTNTFEAAGGSGTKTGDNMNLVLPIMMMLTAAAIGSVLLIRRKYHR